MTEQETAAWVVLPAGTKYVLFEELPDLIGRAMGTEVDQVGRRRRLKELRKAVDHGRLKVRCPLTFGPHPFPIGAGLNGSLVMVGDLRDFLRGASIGVRFIG